MHFTAVAFGCLLLSQMSQRSAAGGSGPTAHGPRQLCSHRPSRID